LLENTFVFITVTDAKKVTVSVLYCEQKQQQKTKTMKLMRLSVDELINMFTFLDIQTIIELQIMSSKMKFAISEYIKYIIEKKINVHEINKNICILKEQNLYINCEIKLVSKFYQGTILNIIEKYLQIYRCVIFVKSKKIRFTINPICVNKIKSQSDPIRDIRFNANCLIHYNGQKYEYEFEKIGDYELSLNLLFPMWYNKMSPHCIEVYFDDSYYSYDDSHRYKLTQNVKQNNTIFINNIDNNLNNNVKNYDDIIKTAASLTILVDTYNATDETKIISSNIKELEIHDISYEDYTNIFTNYTTIHTTIHKLYIYGENMDTSRDDTINNFSRDRFLAPAPRYIDCDIYTKNTTKLYKKHNTNI